MHLTKFYLIQFPPRQRIYSCSLDFFCADKMYPVRLDQCLCSSALLIPALRDGPGLKEDLQILLKFWSMMLSDKKYIKTQIVGGKSTFFLVSKTSPSDSCASHV